MKRWIILGITSLAVVFGVTLGQSDEPREALRTFMRVKLKHSQKVLEGLVLENFDDIAKNAQEMSLLSLAETWQVLQTPQYHEFSRKFRNAVDTLSDSAKKRNLEQTTLAYNKVTVQCVECHKYLRDQRVAKATQK